MLHGLATAVRAQLLVQVPQVSLDRVRRHIELAGDLGGVQVSRQVAQHPGFALGQGLARAAHAITDAWRGVRCRRGPARRREQTQDLRDQADVAVPEHSGARLPLQLEDSLGPPEPVPCFAEPPLGDHGAAQYRAGDGDRRLVAAVLRFR